MLLRHIVFSNGTSFKNKIVLHSLTVVSKNFYFSFNCLFVHHKMPLFASTKNEDAIRSQKGIYILGKDIREIPCLRSSILLGITCGTFAGLISFMTTSRVAMSCHIGFGSLWVVVFAYWIPCRYNYETIQKIKQLQYEDSFAKNSEFANKTPLVKPAEEKKE